MKLGLSIAAFAVLMAARDAVEGVVPRMLLAAVAAAALGFGLLDLRMRRAHPEARKHEVRESQGARAVPKTVVIVIGLLWAIAWFLPAIDTGPGIEGSAGTHRYLPGWQAFRAAIDPLISGKHEEGAFLWETLSVLSALTNVLFVAAAIRLLAAPYSATKSWFWALLIAAGVNTFWMIDGEVPPDGLCAGYYVWFGSFVLLAIVACVGATELCVPRPQPAS